MDKQSMLTKVIKRAEKSGFKWEELDQDLLYLINGCVENTSWHGENYETNIEYQSNIFPILFDHNFAKAIFKKDWKKHLQNAVISDNPLKYYYENNEKSS